MKNFLITIVLLLSAMAVQAQTSPAAKKEVADIRKQYAEAKQEMEALDKKERQGLPSNKTVFSSSYNEVGIGPAKEGQRVLSGVFV